MIDILLPTYRNTDYIKSCLDSLHKSFKEYHIHLGLDGCAETEQYLKKISLDHLNISIFKSGANVGPYVIRNSLVKQSKSDYILFFDTDDEVYEPFGETIVTALTRSEYVRFGYDKAIIEKGKIKHKYPVSKVAEGVFAISRKLLEKYSGFYPWRCGADTEFYHRLVHHHETSLSINKPLFLRRIHDNNLTRNVATNFASETRKAYMAMIDKKIETGIWPNPMAVTTDLNLIYENTVTRL